MLFVSFVVKKIREISVNPWLMNYLCAYKAPFCAFLWLTKTVFSWLLKKAVSMALWTKASLFSYITPSFRPQMARYASRFTRYELCSLLKQSLPRTPSRPTTNQRQSAKSAFKIPINPWLLYISCFFVLIRGKKNPVILSNFSSCLRAFVPLWL